MATPDPDSAKTPAETSRKGENPAGAAREASASGAVTRTSAVWTMVATSATRTQPEEGHYEGMYSVVETGRGQSYGQRSISAGSIVSTK